MNKLNITAQEARNLNYSKGENDCKSFVKDAEFEKNIRNKASSGFVFTKIQMSGYINVDINAEYYKTLVLDPLVENGFDLIVYKDHSVTYILIFWDDDKPRFLNEVKRIKADDDYDFVYSSSKS